MANTFELNVRCGDCVFFQRHKHDDFNLPCSKEGKIVTSTPCRRWSPDGRGVTYELLMQLVPILQQFDSKERHITAGMLRNADALKTTGLTFLERVVVRLRGGDYMSNFAYATVIGKATDGRISILGKGGFTGLVEEKSIIRLVDFTSKVARMLREDKINDPTLERPVKKKPNDKTLPRPEDIPVIGDQLFGQAFAKSLNREQRGAGRRNASGGRTYELGGGGKDE